MHVQGTVCCILADHMNWNVSVKFEADSSKRPKYSMIVVRHTHTHTHTSWQKKERTLTLLTEIALTLARGPRYTETYHVGTKPTNGTYWQASDSEQIWWWAISKTKSINISVLSCWEIKATNWNSILVSKILGPRIILGLSHWMPVLCLRISPQLTSS